ncbi:MAG: polysaccharide deacetylase family protein [Myxococcales bacterium]|nr:polysaccharide deacetylase family protein [Myxococcales bacterium]
MAPREIAILTLSFALACGSTGAGDAGSTEGSTEASTASSGATSDATGATRPTADGTDGDGTVGSTGEGTSADGSTGEDPPPPGSSDLPVPPGPDDVPPPAGEPGNLRVLDWAGFAAAVSYTFDDGQPTHIQHWPALQATGVNMTFYISTGNAGLEGFAEMFMDAHASGSEVANHTVNHCYYDQACGSAPAGSHDAELDDADAYITGTLGVPGVWTMAYPFGDLGYRDAAQARYFMARGTSAGRISPSDGTDPFDLPTLAALGGEGQGVFDAAIDDTRAAGDWVTFLFHSILPGENWYAGVDVGVITGSIEHAQSYGDVWIDSVVRVGAYWAGQLAVENATTMADGAAMVLTWSLPAHFPPGRHVRVTVDGGTVSQGGVPLAWDGHGYYEVALDAGSLTIAP